MKRLDELRARAKAQQKLDAMDPPKVKQPKFNDRYTADEQNELEALEAEIKASSDETELDELGSEVRELIARAEHGVAMRELRKEYNLPSLDQEIEQLKSEIYDLERQAAIRHSREALPRR